MPYVQIMIGYQKHNIWTNIEDLKNIKLNALPVYDDRYIEKKTTVYGDKAYTNFCGSYVPKDDIECESFTFISVYFLLIYKNESQTNVLVIVLVIKSRK